MCDDGMKFKFYFFSTSKYLYSTKMSYLIYKNIFKNTIKYYNMYVLKFLFINVLLY